MAVKYRGGTSAKKAATTELAITLPAGTVSGDHAILCVAAIGQVAGTFTTPAGWTVVEGSNKTTENGTKKTLVIFARTLTGTEGENLPTLKYSESTTIEFITAISEVGTFDAATPVDAHSTNWTFSPAADPLIITVAGGSASVSGDLVILNLCETQIPTVAPTGFTKQTSGVNDYLYTKSNAPSGSTSAEVTKDTKVAYNGYVVAIKAPAEEAVAAEVMMV